MKKIEKRMEKTCKTYIFLKLQHISDKKTTMPCIYCINTSLKHKTYKGVHKIGEKVPLHTNYTIYYGIYI